MVRDDGRPLATSSLAVGRFALNKGSLRSPRGRLVASLNTWIRKLKASIITLQISSFHVESSLLTVFSGANIKIFGVRKARFTCYSDPKRSACLSLQLHLLYAWSLSLMQDSYSLSVLPRVQRVEWSSCLRCQSSNFVFLKFTASTS